MYSNYNTPRFLFGLLGWGYLDINRAMTIWEEAWIDTEELGYYASEYLYQDKSYPPIDIVAITYQYILDSVRTELGELYDNDVHEIVDSVSVYGNYICSCYTDYDDLKRFLDQQDKTHWSQSLHWFYQDLE